MTLTEFLTARLDEDEAAARAAPTEHEAFPPDDEYYWCPAARPEPLGDLPGGPEAECECGVRLWEPNARVLAEVAAKRRIVETVESRRRYGDYGPWLEILETLAAVYADHPDYRQEWA